MGDKIQTVIFNLYGDIFISSLLQPYNIDRRQATVAEWVALRPIFEACTKETGYEEGGRQQEPWWRQAEANNQLRSTLEEISATSRERRQQESGRRGGGKGWEEDKDSERDRQRGGG